MKRFAIILLAAAALVGSVGVASAQHRGGSSSGGSMHSGGNWNSSGGSSWRGGGNSWQGGSSWHGGGNWHGGGWHGHGSRVFVGVGFGGPWWGWWPGYYSYYPYSAYYAGYPYYSAYPYYADYPYGYDYAPSYVQKDAPTYTQPRSFQGGEYSYYCPDPAGYYPQIATCASGWLRVVPSGTPGPTAPTQR